MNWIARLVTIIDLLLFEARSLGNNAWRHIRRPLWLYVVAIAVLIVALVLGVVIAIAGTLADSDWTIFAGGIIVLAGIVFVGVLLYPIALALELFRRRRLRTTKTVNQTTTTAAPAAASTGGHP